MDVLNNKIKYSTITLCFCVYFGACSGEGSPGEDLDASKVFDSIGDLSVDPHDIQIGPPVTLSLATFNVYNFFDEYDDPHHSDTVVSATEAANKISLLGKAIRMLGADILALQEVEDKVLLERLNQEELADLNYGYLRLVEGNDPRGINVALLSRYPVTQTVSHTQDRFLGVDGDTTTYGFSRDCLEVTIEPSPGRKLILLINHLRAYQWSEPEESVARRYAQAQRVREIADAIFKWEPNANLAIVGDLNDVPESKTLQLIQNGDPRILDPTLVLPAQERYTFEGEETQIDYILVSPGLNEDLIAGSVEINHNQIFSDASDHFPVKARFVLE